MAAIKDLPRSLIKFFIAALVFIPAVFGIWILPIWLPDTFRVGGEPISDTTDTYC